MAKISAETLSSRTLVTLRHVWMDVAFPSRADVRILADEPVSHLVGLPLDARHALRRQLVAAELLENVVARGAAVDPGRNKSRDLNSKVRFQPQKPQAEIQN